MGGRSRVTKRFLMVTIRQLAPLLIVTICIMHPSSPRSVGVGGSWCYVDMKDIYPLDPDEEDDF